MKINRKMVMEARAMYAEGETMARVCRVYRVSDDTMRRIVRGLHPSLPEEHRTDISRADAVKRSVSKENMDWMLEQAKKGVPLAHIARQLQIKPRTVSYYVTKFLRDEMLKEPEKPKPAVKRTTIFTWARKWEADFDARGAT